MLSWPPLALLATIVIAGGAVIIRATRGWGDTVHRDYHQQQQETRSAIEVAGVIPALSEIVDDAIHRSAEAAIDVPALLASSEYRDQFVALWDYARDMGRIQLLPSVIVRWMVAEAVAIGIFLIGAALLMVPLISTDITFDQATRLFGFALAVVGFVLAVLFFILEQGTRRWFNRIVRTYAERVGARG